MRGFVSYVDYGKKCGGWGVGGWRSPQTTFDATNPDAPFPFARRTTYPLVPNLKLLSDVRCESAVTSASATGSRVSFGVLVWVFIHLPNATSAILSPTLLRSALSLRIWLLLRVDWSMDVVVPFVDGSSIQHPLYFLRTHLMASYFCSIDPVNNSINAQSKYMGIKK